MVSAKRKLISCVGHSLRVARKLDVPKPVHDCLQAALYALTTSQKFYVPVSVERKVAADTRSSSPAHSRIAISLYDALHLSGGGNETENYQREEAELEYLPCDLDEKTQKSEAADSKFMYVDIGDLEQVESVTLETTATNEIEHHDKSDSAGPVADVFQQSPEMFVQSHLANAADAREALDGLCYLKKSLREQIRTLQTPSPSRSWMVRVYLEVGEEIRRRQSSDET